MVVEEVGAATHVDTGRERRPDLEPDPERAGFDADGQMRLSIGDGTWPELGNAFVPVTREHGARRKNNHGSRAQQHP